MQNHDSKDELTENVDSRLEELRQRIEADENLLDEDIDLIADIAIQKIRSILSIFNQESSVIDEFEGDQGELIFDISGGDLAVLIGRHGKTLDALQSVVSSLVSNTLGFYYPVVVDIESYKNRRKTKLQSIALNAASRVKNQGGQVRLAPMSAYERRIVHIMLAQEEEIITFSEGEEPERRVVVKFKED